MKIIFSIVLLQCRVAEQVSTQVCRHNPRATSAGYDVSFIRGSLRPGRRSTAENTPETATACLQELGACMVARQRGHVSRWRHRVATQPADARSFLCSRCVTS